MDDEFTSRRRRCADHELIRYLKAKMYETADRKLYQEHQAYEHILKHAESALGALDIYKEPDEPTFREAALKTHGKGHFMVTGEGLKEFDALNGIYDEMPNMRDYVERVKRRAELRGKRF